MIKITVKPSVLKSLLLKVIPNTIETDVPLLAKQYKLEGTISIEAAALRLVKLFFNKNLGFYYDESIPLSVVLKKIAGVGLCDEYKVLAQSEQKITITIDNQQISSTNVEGVIRRISNHTKHTKKKFLKYMMAGKYQDFYLVLPSDVHFSEEESRLLNPHINYDFGKPWWKILLGRLHIFISP